MADPYERHATSSQISQNSPYFGGTGWHGVEQHEEVTVVTRIIDSVFVVALSLLEILCSE